MKIIVKITSNFKKESKPLFKRYASLKTDLANLEKELYLNPTLGTSLGNNTYKIRLKISSKGKGKVGVPGLYHILKLTDSQFRN